MTQSRSLTLDTLKRLGACRDQLDLFKAAFGRSTPVTPELCLEYADLFNWHWAANNLLSSAAWAEYKKAIALAFCDAFNGDENV